MNLRDLLTLATPGLWIYQAYGLWKREELRKWERGERVGFQGIDLLCLIGAQHEESP